jgi:D-alanyl-D-alanine dipeptidase
MALAIVRSFIQAKSCGLNSCCSIDMGAGFDCFNEIAHTNANVSASAHANRLQLLKLMQQRGFVNYDLEFWHFTLVGEPYPSTFFDFPIQRPCDASSARGELQGTG